MKTQLRRFTTSDYENMRLLESEADIVKFTPMRIPQTPEQSRTRLKRALDLQPSREPLGTWAIELSDTKEFVGWCMLTPTELEFPELGYMMVKSHWGKGLVTDAMKQLVKYGFETVGLKGISARTNLDNDASIRVLTKLGFQYSKQMTVEDTVLGGTLELKVFTLWP